jgi:MFS family permease
MWQTLLKNKTEKHFRASKTMSQNSKAEDKHRFLNARNAYAAIVLLGIVSLLGDTVYEGSRGLVPDYLLFLGASAVIVGLVGGLGDFIGYALRLVSGFLADTTKAYWFFIIAGYALIGAIPLLGFAGTLEIAIIFVLLERLGKALRSPARDTVLSVIGKNVGAGKAFGLHELFDQIGAVGGPLIVATLMFYSNDNYQLTYSFLLLPFLMLLVALTYTYKRIGPQPIAEPKTTSTKSKALGKPFYTYTVAVTINTIGLIPVALILYKASIILQPQRLQWIVPLVYVLIQGVDAVFALAAGYAYDKYGVKFLILPFIMSLLPPLFTMIDTTLVTLVIAAFFYGLVLGMQESIYRAAVSQFTPIDLRGTAYGIFNTAYGIGYLISGAVYGLLIDLKAPFLATVLLVIVAQTAATMALLRTRQETKD